MWWVKQYVRQQKKNAVAAFDIEISSELGKFRRSKHLYSDISELMACDMLAARWGNINRKPVQH